MSDYETGYKDGESSLEADIEYHLNERCGQPDGDERDWREYTLWMWGEINRLEDDLEKMDRAMGRIADCLGITG